MSRGNVMIPSRVNAMSHVNATHGNVTSHLMEIQGTLTFDMRNTAWQHACPRM